MLREQIDNGKALEVLRTFIQAQGGDSRVVDDYTLLPQAQYTIPVYAKTQGYVQSIVADDIGVAAMMLGAGRATKEDVIDLAVGLSVLKKVGDFVLEDEPIVLIHSNRENVTEVIAKIQNAYTLGDKVVELPLIYDVVTS